MDLTTMTYEVFEGMLNDVFVLNDDPATTPDKLSKLVLTSVEARPRQKPELKQPFSLTFKSASTDPLPQSIYRLEHPDLGGFDVFLVPVDAGADHVLYEAVFN